MNQSISTLQGNKYKVESLLGSGGFGNTYLATQVALGRKVAIKEFYMKDYCDRDQTTSHVIIHTESNRQIVGRYKQKFLKEAQMIASLKNEHIIQIHDIFEENGTAYYVMDYVEGGSLKDKVEKTGALSETGAMAYIRQVADALSYLHKYNILHLDVKPANILVDQDDKVVVIDFGISKHYDSDGGQTSTTPAGVSKGYAPIEQYQQGSVSGFTPSTDVYSLGATLYFLLTGETPPEASLVYEDGLPSKIKSFSKSIQNVVTTAMSPRRKDRFQTIEEFSAALPDCSITEETTVIVKYEDDNNNDVKKDNRPKSKKSAILIIALLLICLAFGSVAIINNKTTVNKDDLYTELQDYKKNIIHIKLKKWIIRLDKMPDGGYRYASWGSSKSTTSKPNIILNNGRYSTDGNRHEYRFTNSGHEYIISWNESVADQYSDVNLVVTKNGKLIATDSE